MFSLKQLLDGLIEDLLELPVMWIRTHFLVLTGGPSAPFVISRLASRGGRRYLKLRTAAFLDVLLLYALVQGVNAPADKFRDIFLTTILQPEKLNLGDTAFLKILVLLFMFYYAYYAAISVLPLNRISKRILVDACLLYSVMCVAFFFGAFLFFFGNFSGFAKDGIYRTSIYLFDVALFWQVGAMFYSRLHLSQSLPNRPLGIAVCTLASFAIYLLITFVSSGWEGVWPNLNA